MTSLVRHWLMASAFGTTLLISLAGGQTAPEPKPVDEAQDLALTSASADVKTVRKGKRLYGQYCASCHGVEGVGGVAPTNLFDKAWVYGGKPSQIKATIADGVLEKGMPAWQGVVPEPDIDAVAAYLVSRQAPTETPAGT